MKPPATAFGAFLRGVRMALLLALSMILAAAVGYAATALAIHLGTAGWPVPAPHAIEVAR